VRIGITQARTPFRSPRANAIAERWVVVADVAHPLRWIAEQDRFTFWKAEVRDRLVPVEVDTSTLKPSPMSTAI
jgi:hypothetical protein